MLDSQEIRNGDATPTKKLRGLQSNLNVCEALQGLLDCSTQLGDPVLDPRSVYEARNAHFARQSSQNQGDLLDGLLRRCFGKQHRQIHRRTQILRRLPSVVRCQKRLHDLASVDCYSPVPSAATALCLLVRTGCSRRPRDCVCRCLWCSSSGGGLHLHLPCANVWLCQQHQEILKENTLVSGVNLHMSPEAEIVGHGQVQRKEALACSTQELRKIRMHRHCLQRQSGNSHDQAPVPQPRLLSSFPELHHVPRSLKFRTASDPRVAGQPRNRHCTQHLYRRRRRQGKELGLCHPP
mmetsp:Transcript_24531/g.62409  ORF Transcript_24531/g.62409 Transcript_24531/m.62409 type:complete len:294 (-) Transcript_24531:3303-4184(-)